jgi:two-component system, NarL family, sensor kinase
LKAARDAPSHPAPPRLPGRAALRQNSRRNNIEPAGALVAPGSPNGGTAAGGIIPLDAQLTESSEALRAIRSGEVDALLLAGTDGNQVFTLQGAEHAYRVLIESMNEGALTLTAGKMILYANQCFARMVKCPLQQVIGSSFRRFLSVADRASLRALLKRSGPAGSKIQLRLHAADGSHVPAQVSIRPQAATASDEATLSLVVTDMTEARRSEEMLRALTHRIVQVQEAERGRVAVELHDNITQLLCALLFRSQALVDGMPARDGPAKREAVKLRVMLGRTADEVERISRNLRPGKLEQLGLVEVLRDIGRDFAEQARVAVRLDCVELTARLPADTELALYRILQEALMNVQKHARARRVIVSLKQRAAFVQFVIKDDGIGFDSHPRPSGRKHKGGLGLLGMRERAACVGGSLEITSVRGAGTEIKVRIPTATAVATAAK